MKEIDADVKRMRQALIYTLYKGNGYAAMLLTDSSEIIGE